MYMILLFAVLTPILLLFLFGVCCFLCVSLRRTPRGFRAECKEACEHGVRLLAERAYTDLYLTDDHKRLHARLYPNGQSGRFVLLLHGYHSSPERDFAALFPFYLSHGYGLMLVDQRAHGLSGGRFVTFGIKEAHDTCGWCRLLARRFPGCQILLHGASMGGTTALLSTRLTLPENVVGIVDDCGYDRPFDQLVYAAKRKYHLPRAAVCLVDLFFRLFIRASLRSPSAAGAAADCSLPKLFFHGKKDSLVPYQSGMRVFGRAAPPKRFVSIEQADHVLCHTADREKYERELAVFVRQILD